MEKNTVLVIVVSVLVVIAAIQAVELTILKDRISSGTLSSGTASRSVNVQSSGSSPNNVATQPSATDLDQLSGMVGGC